jgi:hypothetical protein
VCGFELGYSVFLFSIPMVVAVVVPMVIAVVIPMVVAMEVAVG